MLLAIAIALLGAPASGAGTSGEKGTYETVEPPVPGSWTASFDELSQVQLDRWTTHDGLPLTAVERVIQGPDGYLWLATQEGVVRFDGYDFDVYTKMNSGLRSNNIYSMHVDPTGVLWIGTRSGGVARYQDGTFVSVEIPGLDEMSIASIASDPSGSLVLGMSDSTVVRATFASDGSVSTTPVAAPHIQGITKVLTDDSGAVWIATREHGLFRYGQGVTTSFVQTGALTSTYINDLSIAPDGSIWVATDEDGIARIQGYRIHTYGQEAGLPPGKIRGILADPNGTVWIGTEAHGIWRLTGGVISQPDGLGGDQDRDIRDIHFDREGSVWMATDQGLQRIRNARFKTYGVEHGLPTEYVQTTMEASDGAIWIGTQNGVARLFEGKVDSDFPEIGEVYVYSLAEDARGRVWIGTRNGIWIYDEGSLTHRTAASGHLPHDVVFALSAGPSGIWMGGRLGVALLTDDGFTNMSSEQGLSSNDVTTIYETAEGDLWVGTYDAGLDLVRGDSVVANYIAGAYITVLYEDHDRDLWVGIRGGGSGGGLALLKGGILYEFREEHGMLSDIVSSILEDEDGGIWMTSNVGASRVQKSMLLDFAHNRIQTITPEVFTDRDGLRTREFNGGTQPSGWAGSDGRLWLPGPQGLVSVNPYEKNDVAPYVIIEHFRADEYHGRGDVDTVLEPGTQRFEFTFTAPSFVAPGKTSFSYRLEGYDRGWVQLGAGGSRQAVYTNLAPGVYTFRVRAQNGDGVWSENEASVTFELVPFYWQTTWFRALCVFLFVLAGGYAYHRRMAGMRARAAKLEALVDERTKDLREAMRQTEDALEQTEIARQEAEAQRELAEEAKTVIEQQANQLREMDRIKTRFFNNISHEFRTPLTLNIGPMENAMLGEYGQVSPELRRQLEVMLRNSRRLLRLINQLLDLSKLESGRMKLKVTEGNLTELVEGIVYSFTPFAERKELDLSFNNELGDAEFLFDPLGLEKVFFNLLSNAVKFTPDGGTISVYMEPGTLESEGKEVEAVTVTVSDTGQGIPEKDLEHIFDRFHQVDGTVSKVQEGTGIGLALVKELVELHGGRIRVKSLLGEGTEFQVTLPLDASLLGSHEVIVDGYAVAPAELGPMVEMAVFEEAEEESEAHIEVADDAPLVLVVDDSPDIREYVAQCLKSRYRVVTATDGAKGLEMARIVRPNLVVSDVMMPNMTGFEMTRALRENDVTKQIPVVLVTSKATPEDKIEGLEAGANDYVAKPFSARELLARVENLLRVQEQKSSLERLNSDLLASNTALRQASEMKSQLLSIASHDMKNPLTAIREFARILREESDQTHQLELLDMIFDSSNDMLALISQLLDSAALEGGNLEVAREQTDLVDLAERVVERNVRMADRKGQVIHMTMDDAEACAISVDGERIREAMDNLISNAIKYSPLKSNIYVSMSRQRGEVVFSVRDEGPGLTDEDHSRVFGKFRKLSARPTGGETSTGLGLSIVKQIIELHGGRVFAEGEPGKGSTFTFVVPDLASDPIRDRPALGRQDRASGRGSTPEGQA